MTEKDKKIILDMRAAGIPYKAISEKLGIEVSALKVFVHRNNKPSARKCCLCGKHLPVDARTTQRFCSLKCKNAWWKRHPNQDESEKRVVYTCAVCGTKFISYNRNSSYCSRACYYASRRRS